MPANGRRRAYGQHFLVQPALCSMIVERFLEEASSCHSIIEIGPGRGALTELLLENSRLPVRLYERDVRLADRWKDQAEVHAGDFLKIPREDWLKNPPLGVISNLPYSSGTAILQKLARESKSIPVMTLMFQREVARRLRAVPNTREWGSLSLWIQNRWEITKVAEVPPGAFSPPPEVHSEVVLLKRRETPLVPVAPDQEGLWEALLKTCFARRRKMLRSSLPKTGPWRGAIETAGINPTLRAEALSWDDWRKFFLSLDKSAQPL